jgi:hypothetical protein
MKKIIESISLGNLEVLTDNGWVDVKGIHKTIPYIIFEVKTKNFTLRCADEHILFNDKMEEIFVKDLSVGDLIITKFGCEKVIEIINTNVLDNMYDLELSDESNRRYFTDNILSHNTTYLRYLTKQIKEKNVLFIPPSMAEMLSEPSIIPFLMDNRNSILLIEDAERVIADREGKGSPAGVSNILNLTDGILGDCLNIQVIATFNMKRERIDSALLRKGRLICEHKFDKLNIEDTNTLLTHLKKGICSDKPLTLADIYNIEVDEARLTKDSKKIGFTN